MLCRAWRELRNCPSSSWRWWFEDVEDSSQLTSSIQLFFSMLTGCFYVFFLWFADIWSLFQLSICGHTVRVS